MDFIITPAYAQGAAGGGGGIIMQLLPFLMIFLIIYMLILRPQQKRMKEHTEMISNLRRGDTVVTSGGLIGKVTKVTDGSDEIEVELSRDTTVTAIRSTIAEVRSKNEPVKAKSEAAKASKK